MTHFNVKTVSYYIGLTRCTKKNLLMLYMIITKYVGSLGIRYLYMKLIPLGVQKAPRISAYNSSLRI